jgi:RecT family
MTADVGVPAPVSGGDDTGTPIPSNQVEPVPPAVAADVPASWSAAMRLASRIHNTRFVPKALRGDPHEVLACILTGQELGLGPMTSLRMINVIDGRPAAGAELMRALVNRAGHRLSVVEAAQDHVTLYGQRRDTGSSATVTWTVEDAKRAQLWGKGAWATYPRSMLLARATSELCRQIFSDVIGGLYTPEETAAIEGHVWQPEGELVDPVTHRQSDRGVSQDPGAATVATRVPSPAGEPAVGAGSPDQPTLDEAADEQ